MKKIVLLTIMTLFAIVPLSAQYSPCYKTAFAEGKSFYDSGHYNKALERFNEAKKCPDPNMAEVTSMIQKCRNKIEEYDEKRRLEEEKKREQDSLLALERTLAEKGYMEIKGVYFVNVNYVGGNIVPLSQKGAPLYDTDLRYIRPIVKYKSLDTKNDTVTLYVKMLDRNGKLLKDYNSFGEFTYSCRSIIRPNNDTLCLKPWGNGKKDYYSSGEYGFELWIYDNNTDSYKELHSALFHVENAPLKEIPVELSVGLDAEIWINGVLRGKQNWTGTLSPGQHKIVCKKEGHLDSEKTITLKEGMPGQVIELTPPKPLGTLNIKSKPESAHLYVDGKPCKVDKNNFDESPFHIDNVSMGEHKIRLEKTGYKDYNGTVFLSEEKRDGKLDVKMERERKLGYFFLDFVTGNFIQEDRMLGAHFAVCPRYVGGYGQFLYGIDYSSYQATTGVTVRLTRDYVDLQLYTGAGYGCFRTSQYEEDASFLIDFGGRLGWRSRTQWAMWDVMGGCSVTPDGKWYPYAGVGTGFSLSGAVAMLILWANGTITIK